MVFIPDRKCAIGADTKETMGHDGPTHKLPSATGKVDESETGGRSSWFHFSTSEIHVETMFFLYLVVSHFCFGDYYGLKSQQENSVTKEFKSDVKLIFVLRAAYGMRGV